MEHKKRKARPHDSGKEMITVGIQTNVEIVSSSPARGKYSEKEYERLFIRESGMRARDGYGSSDMTGSRCRPTSTMC